MYKNHQTESDGKTYMTKHPLNRDCSHHLIKEEEESCYTIKYRSIDTNSSRMHLSNQLIFFK